MKQARIGIVTLGHYVYFQQFENLREELMQKSDDFETDESELRLPGIFGFAKFMIDWANDVQEQDAREKNRKHC